MNAKEKESETQATPEPIDPHEPRRVLHRVEPPFKSVSLPDNKGQPKLQAGGMGVEYCNNQTISHVEATADYLEAIKREDSAREVREFWAVVLASWNDMTEPVNK